MSDTVRSPQAFTPGLSPYLYEVLWRIALDGPLTAGAITATRGRGCEIHASASYEHMPDVDGEQLRDTGTWQRWATAQGHPAAGIADLAARRGDVRQARALVDESSGYLWLDKILPTLDVDYEH